ncbi:ABC transporter ATP-binding protein [Dactylosporangium sp. NPDC050588]|uniref:ABC transporter ATP-binding protein n=1 Tax=Dactylosporangium sp. NPDC050588 TaxID=3157211 RepID=UPI0033DEE4EB
MDIITVTDLRKRYGERDVVDGVSFAVREGEIFGILGPNGAGKTTTVECIAGLRRPDGGTISVLGPDPRRHGGELRHQLGMQLQESHLPDRITVAEALRLYSSFYRDPADWEALLSDLGLSEQRRTRFGKLSGGQKQRVSIALALVGNPRVAVLDELTTGLDPQARRDAWDVVEQVRSRGVTVVLVTHLMDEAERLCDRVALIDAGRVVALDSPAGLVAKVDAPQRMRFRPASPLDDRLLTELPEVTGVTRQGPQVIVTGTGNLVHAVTAVLARNQIIAADLRVEQSGLDDAFLALTGRRAETQPDEQGA